MGPQGAVRHEFLDENVILNNIFFPQCTVMLKLKRLNNWYLNSFQSVSGGKNIQHGVDDLCWDPE